MSLSQSLRKVVWAVIGGPLECIKLWLIKRSCVGHVDGIAICDLSISSLSAPDAFFKATREAMTLVQTLDPRRHRRICRQVRYIVNQELAEGGSYERRGMICNVDYSRYLISNNPEWRQRSYALLLIHEATHGLLHEKKIPYDKANRSRVEKLCHLEEYRFALRFEAGYANYNPGAFDAGAYEPYWDDTGQARRNLWWDRIRRAFQDYVSSDRK